MLIDLLQYQIPQLESLETAADFNLLQDRLVQLTESIAVYAAAKYATELSALNRLSGWMLQNKPKTQNDFSKAKTKALQILNTILEMED